MCYVMRSIVLLIVCPSQKLSHMLLESSFICIGEIYNRGGLRIGYIGLWKQTYGLCLA